MRRINNEQGAVLRECARAMRLPLLMEVPISILTGALGILTADTLGSFADAAFALDFSMGLKKMAALAVCIGLTVFVLPLLGMLSDFVMLKEALRHDMVVFGHYLDKRIEKGMVKSGGKIRYELEDAPNILRIQWLIILSKALSLPFCLGYFLYCVGSISWIMAFLMLVIPAVKLGVPVYFKEKLAAYDRTEKEYEAKRRDYETDLVYRAYIARLWNIGSGLRERIDRLFREYYDQSAGRQVTCRVLSERIQALTEQASMVLLLLAGAVMVAQGKVSPGEFASLFVYLSVAQTFFRDAGEILENYPLLLNAAERVSKFYQDEEKTGEETAEYFTGLSGEKLSFSYAERKILSDLDFQIKAGEKVRICGENGRGKSTLLKILCTSLENYEGVIQIGDADLRTVNKESWRSEIAYAPQTPFLFCDTVRENLLADYGDEAKRLMEQFGIAHLAERVICADSDLSGGERQKISLVRTFLKDSSVLILDEPSNHLDQESTRILREYLNRSKKTVILVTHDDALADLADRCIQI